MLRIRSKVMQSWPPLAWVATCKPGEPSIDLVHGSDVEVHDGWFGEIAWEGRFESADFDQVEHCFGSGGRIRGDQCVFVASASVLDRLHRFTSVDGGVSWVSNTLPGLMSLAALEADPRRTDYPQIFWTICRGVRQYERRVPMKTGAVDLVYRNNLRWDGKLLTEQPKPTNAIAPRSFGEYRDSLVALLGKLADNWGDPARRVRYDSIASVSTGYDSPTGAAIGKSIGLHEAVTITESRSGASDDGSAIANYLGLTCHRVARSAWRDVRRCEPPFLASDAKGEDVYFAAAGSLLRRRVLLTGYGGTRVWGIGPKLSLDFERGDQSGLSHTEARLHAGYLHLPVPFLLATDPPALRRIATSSEMQPWHVDGKYNCPLARRIVEEQGVPREAFGMKKNAASVLLFDRHDFLSADSRREFLKWYAREVKPAVSAAAKLSQVTRRRTGAVAGVVGSLCRTIGNAAPGSAVHRLGHSSRLREYAVHEPLFAHLFPWACGVVIAENYARPVD